MPAPVILVRPPGHVGPAKDSHQNRAAGFGTAHNCCGKLERALVSVGK